MQGMDMDVIVHCTCLPVLPAAQQAALKLMTQLAAHLPHTSLASIVEVCAVLTGSQSCMLKDVFCNCITQLRGSRYALPCLQLLPMLIFAFGIDAINDVSVMEKSVATYNMKIE